MSYQSLTETHFVMSKSLHLSFSLVICEVVFRASCDSTTSEDSRTSYGPGKAFLEDVLLEGKGPVIQSIHSYYGRQRLLRRWVTYRNRGTSKSDAYTGRRESTGALFCLRQVGSD